MCSQFHVMLTKISAVLYFDLLIFHVQNASRLITISRDFFSFSFWCFCFGFCRVFWLSCFLDAIKLWNFVVHFIRILFCWLEFNEGNCSFLSSSHSIHCQCVNASQAFSGCVVRNKFSAYFIYLLVCSDFFSFII